ncbi:MAG: LrgB family protein [Alphaproteobacteria bacterium]
MNFSLDPMIGFGIALTAGAYALSLVVRKRYSSPLTTPVLFGTVVVIVVLLLCGVSSADYAPAKHMITELLGPATVALALPLYKNRQVFVRNLLPAACGIVAGSLGTMITAGLVASAFAFAPEIAASLSIKSATVPIAVEIARTVHANLVLTALFVVITGMIGAAFGPWLMDRCRITHPVARGLALGTVSHGQGTAQAATEGEFTGAVAGVAMGLGAICTALAAPYVVPLLTW